MTEKKSTFKGCDRATECVKYSTVKRYKEGWAKTCSFWEFEGGTRHMCGVIYDYFKHYGGKPLFFKTEYEAKKHFRRWYRAKRLSECWQFEEGFKKDPKAFFIPDYRLRFDEAFEYVLQEEKNE